jgi:hypothetical protein
LRNGSLNGNKLELRLRWKHDSQSSHKNSQIVFVRGGKDAALAENNEQWENPRNSFPSPLPHRVNQKWTKEEKLKVDRQVPGEVQALVVWHGVVLYVKECPVPVGLAVWLDVVEKRPLAHEFHERNGEQNKSCEHWRVPKVSMQIHSQKVDSISGKSNFPQLVARMKNSSTHDSSAFRSDQVTRSPPMTKKVSTQMWKLAKKAEGGVSSHSENSLLLVTEAPSWFDKRWPKIIHISATARSPLRQSIEFFDFLFVMSKSFPPFV